MFRVLTNIYRRFAKICCYSTYFLPEFFGQSLLEDVDLELPQKQLRSEQTIECKNDNILSDPVSQPVEVELDPIEQKRARNRVYKQRYAAKKKREKEEMQARQIILEFKNKQQSCLEREARIKREQSTPEELSGFIQTIGQTAADILHRLLGEDEFQEFVQSYSGDTKLNLIYAMIAALEQIIGRNNAS